MADSEDINDEFQGLNRQNGLPNVPFKFHAAYDHKPAPERGVYLDSDESIDYQRDILYREDRHYESDDYNSDQEEPGDRILSPPPSPETNEVNFVVNKVIIPSSQMRSDKTLPKIPVLEKPQLQSKSPAYKKRKNYFNFGRLVTNVKSFKKSKDIEIKNRHISNPIPIVSEAPSQSALNVLPTLAPSSPISHQLPVEYFPDDFNRDDEDSQSVAQTTSDLTMDDLYHLVLNMQKGFQLQVNEMSSQINELKREIGRLKGEESEDEVYENEDDLEESMGHSVAGGNAASVRSVTRQMDKYGGAGRWFHNEYI